ncbi:hypothetical protein [Luteimonas sp. e5]
MRIPLFILLPVLLMVPPPGAAQERVVPAEHVRYDYAQVLSVEPVYQILTSQTTVRRCDERGECREVTEPRETRRPIAYDVMYTHNGVRYRSRLAQDPGRRLRIRIGITPMVDSRVQP